MLTPFSVNLKLDEETLASELEYQMKAGVNGVCILGGTGESMSLTPQERVRVVEVTMKVVGERIPVIVGCFVPEVEEAASFGKKIKSLGATAMMLTPPAFYKQNAYQFGKLLEDLTKKTSVPLVIYNAPGRVATRLSVADLVSYISKHHQIIGVKDATNDIRDVLYMGEGFGKKAALLQGLDDGFIPTLASGGSGGLMAFVCPVPEIFVGMYRAWGKGDMKAAVEKQLSIVPAMKAVGREPMPVLVKEAMNVVGRPMGPVRPPLYEAEAGNKRLIWAEVEKLVKG